MSSPAACRFTESHEWLRREDDVATIGISQYAADEMTDLIFIEMKPVGTVVAVGDSLGEIESVKTANDVYSAVAGEIIEVNQAAADDPSLVNGDPFGDGWLVKLRLSDPAQFDALMDQPAYDEKHPVG